MKFKLLLHPTKLSILMGVRGARKRRRMKEKGLSRARRRRIEGLGMSDVPRPFVLGRRSRKDGVAWTCKCKTENRPSQHLFVNLPAFSCSNPNCKFDPVRVNFRFSFGNLDANGVNPIGLIHRQLGDDCLTFAIAKAAEITVRIVLSLLGIQRELGSFNPYHLRDNFVSSQLDEGVAIEDICIFDRYAKLKMLELLETVGIQELRNEEEGCIYRMKSETIDADFETVAMTLADGYALVVNFALGLNFDNLEYHIVYKAPYNNENPLPESLASHAVVLVGAARHGLMDYYYFVNSHGIQFCLRVANGFHLGGIGKLRAKDILERPHKFLRISVEPKGESMVTWDY